MAFGLIRISCFLCCLLIVKIVFPQAYSVKQFTVDDGLPSSHVYEVKQDKKGFYWICTTQGLVKYDGYSFEQVKRDKNVASEEVWWTYEDNKERLWCLYSGDKLWYLERDTFKFIKLELEELRKGAAFREIYVDKYNHCWISGGSGLYRFMSDTLVHYKTRDLFGMIKMHKAAYPELYIEDGEISFITKYPITAWQPDSLGQLSKRLIYSDTIFHLNYESPEGAITYNENNTTFIYCSPDTLYTIHKKQFRGYIEGSQIDLGRFPAANQLKYDNYKVFKLKNLYAFINSDGNFVTDKNFNYLPEFSFMESWNINTVYEDNEGGVWISTTNQGLLYITKDALAVKSFEDEVDLASGVVGIEMIDNGDKWVAYKNGRLIRYRDEEITKYQVEPVNNNDRNWFLRDIEIIDNLMVLVVGNYEIQVIDLKTINKGLIKPRNTMEFVQARKVEKTFGNKLFVHDYYGIHELDLNTGENDMIFREKSRTISISKKGEYYISTFSGVSKYNPNSMKAATPISNTHLKKFVANKFNDLWAIGNTSGVYRLIDDTIIEVPEFEDYLLHDLWFEGDTSIWAATNEGIVQFSKNVQSDKYEYSRKLTLAHGLLTNEVTALVSDKNYIYVGTSKGFNVVDKSKLSKPTKGYKIHLTEISSRGEKLGINSYYELPPNLNALELSYVYISPKSEGQIKYQYKLEGIDKEWQETGKTSISYPFLPPGDYVFKLKAIDINGIPSSDAILLKIKVNQYWWKTSWFRFIAIGFLVSLIIVFYRLRIRRLRKREIERTELNNRMAELKLKALQSQMDPHFVFNVLNGVQDSFISNNILEANKYLSDFAKLMRLFLDSSDKKHIQLDKEINLLTYYIELERMRFKTKFDYEFRMGDDVEPDELSIPSMLLQPIIENAIKHGLKHKEGKGELVIDIDLGENNEIFILVEDNGVGRKKAEEIKSQRSDAHMGKATSIIDERIEIINASGDGSISLKYVDLMENENPKGTRVELKIDLKINK